MENAIYLKHYAQSAIDMSRLKLVNDIDAAHKTALEEFEGTVDDVQSVLATVKEHNGNCYYKILFSQEHVEADDNYEIVTNDAADAQKLFADPCALKYFDWNDLAERNTAEIDE